MRRMITLGELGKVVTGRTPSSGNQDAWGDAFPFITPSDLDFGTRTPAVERRLSVKGSLDLRGIELPPRAVCVTCIGATIGKMCLTKERSFTNQQINSIVVDERAHDPSYVYYLLLPKSEEFRLRAGGAATPILNKTAFSQIAVEIPTLPVQRRIASILSAYDDLVENNTKRIKILEEMARALYHEWFVRFRFPGHENAFLSHGVPDGWEQKTIGEVCLSLEDGDWIESKDQGGGDFRLLQISNIGQNSFVETGNFRFISEEAFRRLRCREVLPGDILISRMPEPIGRAWYVYEQPWRMVTAVDVAVARANPNQVHPFYLLYHLNSPSHLELCAARAGGATRPRVTRRSLAAMPILMPPLDLQRRFGEFASAMNSLRHNLSRQVDQLKQTRDLLLPRLISGELDVSTLPLPEPT